MNEHHAEMMQIADAGEGSLLILDLSILHKMYIGKMEGTICH